MDGLVMEQRVQSIFPWEKSYILIADVQSFKFGEWAVQKVTPNANEINFKIHISQHTDSLVIKMFSVQDVVTVTWNHNEVSKILFAAVNRQHILLQLETTDGYVRYLLTSDGVHIVLINWKGRAVKSMHDDTDDRYLYESFLCSHAIIKKKKTVYLLWNLL